MLGALLEVDHMFKQCMRLLHEAHIQVKMWKAQELRSTFAC